MNRLTYALTFILLALTGLCRAQFIYEDATSAPLTKDLFPLQSNTMWGVGGDGKAYPVKVSQNGQAMVTIAGGSITSVPSSAFVGVTIAAQSQAITVTGTLNTSPSSASQGVTINAIAQSLSFTVVGNGDATSDGDTIETNLLAAECYPMVFNGSKWDRLRGSTQGLSVAGSITNPVSAPANFQLIEGGSVVSPNNALPVNHPGTMGVSITAYSFYNSVSNNSASQLAAGAVFTGAIEYAFNQPNAQVIVFSDQALTITADQFDNAQNLVAVDSFYYTTFSAQTSLTSTALVGLTRNIQINGDYFRVRVQNAGIATTTKLNIETTYGALNVDATSLTSLGNKKVAITEMGGATVSTGSGAPDSGTQRVALATGGLVGITDLKAVSVTANGNLPVFVTGLGGVSVTSTNLSVNINQYNGQSPALNAGATGAAVPRHVLADESLSAPTTVYFALQAVSACGLAIGGTVQSIKITRVAGTVNWFNIDNSQGEGYLYWATSTSTTVPPNSVNIKRGVSGTAQARIPLTRDITNLWWYWSGPLKTTPTAALEQ